MSEIHEITAALHKFRDDRNWQQFHDSRNLAMAISIEAAELNELFLWKSPENVEIAANPALADELADIFSYCFLLAAKHNLSVKDIVLKKIKQNETRYPIELSMNSSKKYDQL